MKSIEEKAEVRISFPLWRKAVRYSIGKGYHGESTVSEAYIEGYKAAQESEEESIPKDIKDYLIFTLEFDKVRVQGEEEEFLIDKCLNFLSNTKVSEERVYTREEMDGVVEDAYRIGLKDANGSSRIEPFLLTSQATAQLLINSLPPSPKEVSEPIKKNEI